MRHLRNILVLVLFSTITSFTVCGQNIKYDNQVPLNSKARVIASNNFIISKGVNIASWLSTPKYAGAQRVAFIQEADIKLLSESGFDHIRLCVDEVVLWDANGAKIRAYGFDLLHNAINWCSTYNMKVLVDLHITRNHRFTLAENALFTDPNEPAKFVKLWEDFSDELSQYPNSLVAYELLNEPCSSDAENWNRVAALAINAIRAKEPDRTIVVGVCTSSGSPRYDALKIPSTHKILMTFHYYGPFLLTYYGAQSTTGGWKDIPIQYPGQLVPDEWISALPEKWQSTGQRTYNKEVLSTAIQKGLTRASQLGVPVFVGEFGTWNVTPEPARSNWYRDVVAILDENGSIPYTSFDYKGAGYSIVSEANEVKYPEIVYILTKKTVQAVSTVNFSNKPADIDLEAAVFTFVDPAGVETDVPATKNGNVQFKIDLPAGDLKLRKIIFQTSDVSNNRFAYYFPPQQTLIDGEQTLSIAPPQLLSYWQGGMIIVINEPSPLTGTARYNITGAVMAPEIGPKVGWFPNGSTDVTTAMSTTDGATNTSEIIKALGGIGSSANFIARWPIRVLHGAYTDWYLPVANEYLAFNALWQQNKTLFNQKMNDYGSVTLIEGTHNTFWTSENINATQARMYDCRNGGSIVPGTKTFACYGLAFRSFSYVDKGPITLQNPNLYANDVFISINDNVLSISKLLRPKTLTIYSLSGKHILTSTVHDNYSVTLPQKGVYIINLRDERGVITRKVVM